jgi:hypothetical protein
MAAAAFILPPLPSADFQAALGGQRSSAGEVGADMITTRLTAFREGRAPGIARYLADVDKVMVDALEKHAASPAVDHIVELLREHELKAKADADRMDLEARRAVKQVTKHGLRQLRDAIVRQHQLVMEQQFGLCQELRDRRFGFIAALDRKQPSERGETLKSGEDVAAYLASLRKR